MKLVPPESAGLKRRFVLLAPPGNQQLPFNSVEDDTLEHERLLEGLQRLRGSIYFQDGVIRKDQLTADGRHVQPVDARAWHLLTIDHGGELAACVRYTPNDGRTNFADLTVAGSALARSPLWGAELRKAIEADLTGARARGCSFVELGGWAICESLWCSTEAVRMMIAMYALSQLLGGAVCVSTVTTRHASSSILRRIGGRPLVNRGADPCSGVELPTYFDPQYGCEMEILRFDSRFPNPRYAAWIAESRTALMSAPVIRANQTVSAGLCNLQLALQDYSAQLIAEPAVAGVALREG